MPAHAFVDESSRGGRRREIPSVVAQLEVETRIYRARLDGRSERRTRDECFRAMVPELIGQLGVSRMVVESCDQDRQDKQVIREMVVKLSISNCALWLCRRAQFDGFL